MIARLLAFAAVASLAAPASAHFLFLDVADTPDGPQLRAYFSEACTPGEAKYVERMTKGRFFRLGANSAQPVKMRAIENDDETGYLSASLKHAGPCGAKWTYGLHSRGPATMLLHYGAKVAGLDQLSAASGGDLRLNLQAKQEGEAVAATAIFDGQPVRFGKESGQASVTIDGPDGEIEAKTGKNGEFTFPVDGRGTYTARVMLRFEREGEYQDESFNQELFITTFTFLADAQEKVGQQEPTAGSVLAEARRNRAVWDDFGGFRAQLTVSHGGKLEQGTITVDRDGDLKFEGLEVSDAIRGTLRSMMGHRLGSGDGSEDATFSREEAAHPLGRLIELNDDAAMGSAYRVRDGVIRQVNRKMGPGKFTISVLAVHTNPEGKYLPSVYTVHFWNSDGSLRSASTIRETWVRVGGYDLPATHQSCRGGKEEYDSWELTFSEHELLK